MLISLDFGGQHLVTLQVCLAGVMNASVGALPLHLEDMVESGVKVLDRREMRVPRRKSERE